MQTSLSALLLLTLAPSVTHAQLPPGITGDFDNNGTIGATDLAAIITAAQFDSSNLAFDVNNDDIVDQADVMFVEAGFTTAGGNTVTVSDESELRAALTTATPSPGLRITFDSALDGQTILLSNGQFTVPIAQEVFIDASPLSNGLTLDAGQASRIIEIRPNATASLHGLTLTGGNASGQDLIGGAIYNDNATLSLSDCTLSNNSATQGGGGIFSNGNSDDGNDGSATLSLHNCTLSNNSASNDGGGIFNNGVNGNATLSLHNCTLSGNSAGNNGGGIFSDGSNNGSVTLTLGNSTLSNNSSEVSGGGIFNNGRDTGSATLILNDCTLSGNSTNFTGGGIASTGSFDGNTTLSLNGCTLSGNSASFDGGGIENDGFSGNASLSLNNCTLSGNSAESNGGGILSGGRDGRAPLTLTNCTLSGNSAEFNGGGILSDGGFEGFAPLTLINCTLSENSAGDEGGGIFRDSFDGTASLSLQNTILAGNTSPRAPDLADPDNSFALTATGNNLLSSVDGHSLTNNTPAITIIAAADLNLAPLSNYGGLTETQPPLPDSPAIDAGGTTNPGGTDQRGFVRFFGDGLDIGAIEFQNRTEIPNEDEDDNNFEFDSDSDGLSDGLELAIGTDPLVADASDPRNLRLTIAPDGTPQFTLGLVAAQQPNTILTLTRSTDLITFDEVVISNESVDFTDPGAGNLLILTDDSPPAGATLFYRLEATQR